MSWWISHLTALLIGFCLDLLLGDPHWAPHPVRAIGALISVLEKGLRKIFPKSHGGELAGGVVLVLLTLAIPTGLTVLLLWGCWLVSPWLALAVESVISYQLLATKSLAVESRKVYDALKTGDMDKARYAVSMIVGRDTDRLDETGVTKAAVETVAENASDGVIAPLIFLAIGGAPLGMFYKAANTMDSMVGYKNDKYLYFGRAAARWDDILNFIPRIFKRDRKKHKSPNAAHTEAVCAGALQLRLVGPSWYFGKLVEKPYIGDDQRPPEPLDILRAGRILYATAFFALLLFCGVPLLILLFP